MAATYYVGHYKGRIRHSNEGLGSRVFDCERYAEARKESRERSEEAGTWGDLAFAYSELRRQRGDYKFTREHATFIKVYF